MNNSKQVIFSFPGIQRLKTIFIWGSLATLAFGFVYGSCNQLASEASKHYALYTDWELKIPLIPWMIFPYISLNVIFIVSAFVLKTTTSIKGFCVSIILGAFIAGFFFYFFPGKLGFERIIADDYSGLYHFMFSIDHPHNLFPSLHVTYSMLGVLSMVEQTSSKFFHYVLYGWLILISASVVLVHQHHLFDILTGAILAMGLFQFCYRPMNRV